MFPKSNLKIEETEEKSIPITHINDSSFFWLGTSLH
jgi:hypothetical protein